MTTKVLFVIYVLLTAFGQVSSVARADDWPISVDVVCDCDGDGNPDATAAKLFYHPTVSTQCIIPCDDLFSGAPKCGTAEIPGSVVAELIDEIKGELPKGKVCEALTSKCTNDKDKACKLLAEAANKAHNLAEAPPLDELKSDLAQDIAKIRVATCDSRDNEPVRKALETAMQKVKETDPTETRDMQKRYGPIQKAEDALRNASELLGCSAPTQVTPTPSPTPSATPMVCLPGLTPSTPAFKFLRDRDKTKTQPKKGYKYSDREKKISSHIYFKCMPDKVAEALKWCQGTKDQSACETFCYQWATWLKNATGIPGVGEEAASVAGSCTGLLEGYHK